MRKLIDVNALKRLLGISSGFKRAPDMGENYYIEGNSIREERQLFNTEANGARIIACVLISFFSVIIQEAFFNQIRILGAKPNIAIVTVVIIAALSKMRFSMIYGLATGLYIDIIYGKYLGLFALIFMYAAFLSSVVTRPKFKGRALIMGGIGACVLVGYGFFESFLARLMTIYSAEHTILYYNFAEHLQKKFLPELVYNLIVFVILLVPLTLLWKVLGGARKKGDSEQV